MNQKYIVSFYNKGNGDDCLWTNQEIYGYSDRLLKLRSYLEQSTIQGEYFISKEKLMSKIGPKLVKSYSFKVSINGKEQLWLGFDYDFEDDEPDVYID